MYVFSLGLIPQGIFPSQHRTALPSVMLQAQVRQGSKAAKRLGDRMRTQAISKLEG